MKICVNCEALLDDSAIFCSKCGSSDLKTENYNTSVDLEEEKTMLIIPEGDDNPETEDETGILSENMAMNSEPSFSAPVEADVDADATGLLNENVANDFSQPVEAPEISIQPAVQEPVIQQPVAQEPMVQQPVMQQPASQQPIVGGFNSQPYAVNGVMQQPVMQQPVMQQPASQQPIVGGFNSQPYAVNGVMPQTIPANVTQKDFFTKFASESLRKGLKISIIIFYIIAGINAVFSILMAPAALIDTAILLGLTIAFHLTQKKGFAIGLLVLCVLEVILSVALTGAYTGGLWLVNAIIAFITYTKIEKEYKAFKANANLGFNNFQ